jgi:hypothetical protein
MEKQDNVCFDCERERVFPLGIIEVAKSRMHGLFSCTMAMHGFVRHGFRTIQDIIPQDMQVSSLLLHAAQSPHATSTYY